jgi:hypothetical protein
MLKCVLWKDMKFSHLLTLINSNKYSGILYIGDIEENQILFNEGRIVYANYNDLADFEALKEIATKVISFDFANQQKVYFKSDLENRTEELISKIKEIEDEFVKLSYLIGKFVNFAEGSENISLSQEELKFLATLDFKPSRVENLAKKSKKSLIETLKMVDGLVKKSVLYVYDIQNPEVYEYIIDNYPDLIQTFEEVKGDLRLFEKEITRTHRDIARVVLSEIKRIPR